MTLIETNRKSKIGNQKSDEVVVSVRGLTKVFKDFWGRPKARAVDNVDFDVRRRQPESRPTKTRLALSLC